ncbi:3 -n-debenzoyl-2 -deoxytaxol n-benzoyltransferase [Hordeum vulgare]|nr:3 -n-debenzoyl-2 -deoxytaxol n-benzoyltransferase [Hordeum vulgare]
MDLPLKRTPTHYRPVAGRLAADGDGELLRIEGAVGVPFVAAGMADVNVPLLGGLAARYPVRFCRHADSLLLVQVNEFTFGGSRSRRCGTTC